MDEVELSLWDTYWETYFAIRGPIDKPWHPTANETYCTAPTGLASPAVNEDNSSDTQAFPEGFDFSTMLEIHYRLQELDNSRRETEQQGTSDRYHGEPLSTSLRGSNPDIIAKSAGSTAIGRAGLMYSENPATTPGFDHQRKNTPLSNCSDSSDYDQLPATKGPSNVEEVHPSSRPSDSLSAMEATPLQKPTKVPQGHGSSWISPSLYGPPSPFLSPEHYPSVLMQPYYESLTHGPIDQLGSSPVLQPTKAELSFFQGAVAPTLEHLPPPRYDIGLHPKLFCPESTHSMGAEQPSGPAVVILDIPDDNIQPKAHKHVRKSKPCPRSEIGEKYGYHPALRYLWEPELAEAEARLAMAENSSTGSESPEQEYYEGRWGPPAPTRPTTTYEDISVGGETPTTYVEDLPFHACYDDNLVPRKYRKLTEPALSEEAISRPEDPYEWMNEQYREAQQPPDRGLDFIGDPMDFPIPKELKGRPPPSQTLDDAVTMEADDAQVSSDYSCNSMNEPLGLPEHMEQVLSDYQVDDSPNFRIEAHRMPLLKRKLDADEIMPRKKRRISVDSFDDYVFPLTRHHEYDEDLEYTHIVTESFSRQTGKLVAISSGWELRRRANASFRNQRRGKVFSRSQSPSPSSLVGEDSRVVNEGETLVDALSEASSDDPTMIDKEQEWPMPEIQAPYLSNKETSQQPAQSTDTQHQNAHHHNPTIEPSGSHNQSDQLTQTPSAMPHQKPEVVVPTLSPELREKYIEYVYGSKNNKENPTKRVSRCPRGSSALSHKKKKGINGLLKCDRVTRSTPTKEKTLVKLDTKGKQAEPWDGKCASSGGPTKKVRAGRSSNKEPVSRVLSKTRRVKKRKRQTC